jgi:hypothetical protein
MKAMRSSEVGNHVQDYAESQPEEQIDVVISKVFSGYQLCENGIMIQRFGVCLCLYHQGW